MKSLRSGTWAKTLLATTKSAGPEVSTICRATALEKNSFRVGIPAATAAAAMFLAGSTPRQGSPVQDVPEQVAVVAGDLDDP